MLGIFDFSFTNGTAIFHFGGGKKNDTKIFVEEEICSGEDEGKKDHVSPC